MSKVRSKPWSNSQPPKKILAIRFQALGDVVITLPYLQSLKRRYPNCQLHLLTREEDATIPLSIQLFDQVISVGGGRNTRLQFLSVLSMLPRLWLQRYDVVLDLQSHRISKILRQLLRPEAWCEFDSVSPISAGERNRIAIESAGLGTVHIDTEQVSNISPQRLDALLLSGGWGGTDKLVALNPAGFFTSRNWPLENYIQFAQHWLSHEPGTQFILIGVERMKDKATFIKDRLGDSVIDLTCRTNTAEAFALIKKMRLLLTEDGGLMHMAWVQGVPTLALFGSSRKDWSAPLGLKSMCLDSSDLPCGSCMLSVCKFGDVHCLTRYSPEFVCKEAIRLLEG